MPTLLLKIQKFEFESRIFVSFGLVILICALSFSVFASLPVLSVALGGLVGNSGFDRPGLGLSRRRLGHGRGLVPSNLGGQRLDIKTDDVVQGENGRAPFIGSLRVRPEPDLSRRPHRLHGVYVRPSARRTSAAGSLISSLYPAHHLRRDLPAQRIRPVLCRLRKTRAAPDPEPGQPETSPGGSPGRRHHPRRIPA